MIDAASPDASFLEHDKNAPIPATPAPSFPSHRSARFLKYAAFFVAFLGVLYLRRSSQFYHPQVWDEDGIILIPDFIDSGWMSLFHPLNGYLILATKLIVFISLHISFFYYPHISTLLGWVFTAFVCLAITFCPTWMRGRALLGFCALLVPSNAEVIGVPLYAFWWATLLLFLVVVWQNDSRDLLLRTTFLLLGGLSSPLIVLVPPLLTLRLILLDHKRRNAFFLGLSILCALVQYLALRSQPGSVSHRLIPQELLEIFPRFFGNYVLGNLWDNRTLLWIIGSATFAFILAAMQWKGKQPLIPFLLFLCLCAIIMSGLRNPLNILDPRNGGPRYFFYPYVLISWMLVNVAVMSKHIFFKSIGSIMLLLAFANVFPVLARDHLNLHWTNHIASAIHFDRYILPIEFDGINEPWHLPITGNQVRALLATDLFATSQRLAAAHPYPFSLQIIDVHHPPPSYPYVSSSLLAGRSLLATHDAPTLPPGFTVIGSYLHRPADRVSIPLHLHRGNAVLYCSGSDVHRLWVHIQNPTVPFSADLPPSKRWNVLDFSSDQLPQDFTAVFSDDGVDSDEWFALGLKNPLP